jgi:hypothetical protein
LREPNGLRHAQVIASRTNKARQAVVGELVVAGGDPRPKNLQASEVLLASRTTVARLPSRRHPLASPALILFLKTTDFERFPTKRYQISKLRDLCFSKTILEMIFSKAVGVVLI